MAPGRRAEGGQSQSQEKFFWGGRIGGRRTADKKRRKNFVLGSPYDELLVLSVEWQKFKRGKVPFFIKKKFFLRHKLLKFLFDNLSKVIFVEKIYFPLKFPRNYL